jgi:hypothetical protein
MTYIHPLWHDPPSEERLIKGLELLRKAETITKVTDREAAYIATTLAYYDGAADRPEQESLEIFREGWKSVYEAWPDDIEAAAFYALAHMATASPSDKTMAKQTEAGSIAQQVLAQIPDHPAGHHYTIHAYDSPRFADQALAVARNYSEVAPEVPHALHMPTHIFTRLGLWDESIDMNTRSAVAAEKSGPSWIRPCNWKRRSIRTQLVRQPTHWPRCRPESRSRAGIGKKALNWQQRFRHPFHGVTPLPNSRPSAGSAGAWAPHAADRAKLPARPLRRSIS